MTIVTVHRMSESMHTENFLSNDNFSQFSSESFFVVFSFFFLSSNVCNHVNWTYEQISHFTSFPSPWQSNTLRDFLPFNSIGKWSGKNFIRNCTTVLRQKSKRTHFEKRWFFKKNCNSRLCQFYSSMLLFDGWVKNFVTQITTK